MLNTNNIVNYEINIKQKKKKYSLATVLAWLYLKTIGRTLPERWNKWAENILYYDKIIVDQTDALKATDKSILVDLKPEQGIQSEITSKNETTFQCMATQTDGLITIDKVDLKPEVAEENSSEDEGIYSEMSNGPADENIDTTLNGEFFDENLEDMEEICTDHKELNEQLEDVGQELELECSHNVLLKETSVNLESQLKASDENLVKAKETITRLEEELTVASEENKQLKLQLVKYEEGYVELRDISNETKKELSSELEEMREEIRKKDTEIKALIAQSRELEQAKKAMNDKNESLQMQVIKLGDKANELENKMSNLSREKEALQSNVDILTARLGEMKNLKEELQSAQQQLERENFDLEDKLKGLSSKLSATEKENKRLENEVAKLQEQVRTLEREKSKLAEIDDNLKKTSSYEIEVLEAKVTKQKKQIEQLQEEAEKANIKKLEEKENMREQLKIMKQQLLNNQEQQELGKELKSVDKKLENINKKTKEQTKAKVPDTVSIAKSATESTVSRLWNLPNKIFGGKNLNKFLSDKNKKLKENFPEFEGKHFCHNVLDETIKSLSNQSDGKFKSNKLLELLGSNLTKSAREIIKAEVKEIVTKYYNIKNIDKKLRDGVLKDELLNSINKCMEKLRWDKKDAAAITDSVWQSFHSKNNSNFKEIVVKELVKGRVHFFSSNIQSLQLASSIRDTFISPDQKMCSKITGEKNEYQLTEKAKEEYVPNSSMSHTNTVNISFLSNNKRVARASS